MSHCRATSLGTAAAWVGVARGCACSHTAQALHRVHADPKIGSRAPQASPEGSPKAGSPAKCVRAPTGEWATFASSPGIPGSPSASQQHRLQSLLSGQADNDDGGILLTTGGIKSTKQIEAEEAVNQQLLR